MKSNKGTNIALGIFLVICAVVFGFTALFFIESLRLMFASEGFEAIGLIATLPAFFIGLFITVPLTLINLICIIICHKKDKVHPLFYKINLIIDIILLVLCVASIVFIFVQQFIN